MSVIQGTAVTGAGGPTQYQISRSLRFNSADSAYLNRTPASAGNRKTWTWSGWVKRGLLGGDRRIFAIRTGSTDDTYFEFGINSDVVGVGAWTATWLSTTQVFRDPSAWYHFVLAIDTTQATASNRVKVYVNGAQITAFSTTNYPAQDFQTAINSTIAHNIGQQGNNAQYFDGYLTEINFIDGSALDPTSFGEFNTDTGVWQPIKYTGTYGTNGFYLNFSDNASTTTLGDDFSGNGNDWTTNNFSVTAGAGNDSLVDSPTRYGTDTGAGGEVRGNYCTANPLLRGGNLTISNGNLGLNSNSNWTTAYGTFLIPTTGKWYWEVTAGGSNTNPGIALSTSNLSGNLSTYPADTIVSYTYYGSNGNKYTGPGNTNTAYGATFTTNDVIGVAFDADAGTLVFYKNNASQGTAFSSLTSQYIPVFGVFDSGVQAINFGQRPFAYTAPSGFKALVTTNLPEPTIAAGNEYFDASLWTGNNGTQSIVNTAGFAPDLVWLKNRTNAFTHLLYDTIRGAGTLKAISSSETTAEGGMSDNATFGYLSTLNSNGFTVVSGSTANSYTNSNSNAYVGWQWKANGAGVSNTDGSITSTVSANTDSGFSIVTWSGNNGTNATVGHSLGVAPSLIITKNRSGASDWPTYHSGLSSGYTIFLNTTGAQSNAASWYGTNAPTSSVFYTTYIGNISINASSNNYVSYCFAPISGYSAMGSYLGNGSSTDGPFVYTGFRPAYVMIKISSGSTGSWWIWDSARNTYNVATNILAADSSGAEISPYNCDFLSNGFKLRDATGQLNGSGYTIIYVSFAESPFKYSLGR